MLKYVIITVSFFICAVVAAQKAKPSRYAYTQESKKYFRGGELDTIFRQSSDSVLIANGVPANVLEKHFPQIKILLLTTANRAIVSNFKSLENGWKKTAGAVSAPGLSISHKQDYIESLRRAIAHAFYINKSLRQYLYFDNSDRITYFNSTVRIQPDGKLLVTEKISIYNGNGGINPLYANDATPEQTAAVNDDIKRGIVRAFPLHYVNRYKLFQSTTFVLKEVLKDGYKEDYHTEKKANGILVYTGSSSVFLKPGYYTYTITYETDRQLKLLEQFDELYWNVTGNGWVFRIDSAKCTVVLPAKASPLSSKCYTGPEGSKEEDCSMLNVRSGDSTVVIFKTNSPLPPKQGITIATSWPKGFVTARLSAWTKIKHYIWDNKAVFFLPVATLFAALFGFICWLIYGRDPEKGIVYPQFEPPPGHSPAALGYIYNQQFSRQLTVATIVDAAVRNEIKIDVSSEGKIFKHNVYTIKKSGKKSQPPLTPYEDFDSDIDDLKGTTIKKGDYNSALADLNKKIREYCEERFNITKNKKKKGFFRVNNAYMIFPAIICVLVGGWAFFDGLMRAMFMRNFWQIAYFAVGVIICIYVFKLFYYLLPAYTPDGRKMMDKIQGFRMFLSTADERRFDAMNPPRKSLELYEKYLPFAIALGCEIQWGERFEEIIKTAAVGGAVAASSFSSSFHNDRESFGSSFTSSFSGAISSASTPPSSSSGGGSSFGGGSSGGGGGGGGGGGW